ncbi:MAG TPA: FKBP-type peptidyl-prolyl cis-trans isomerase [Steroidobacter sp.]|nr:FKBP-type peptidyl-prolyl cis-trans isomerase [Steroidobacteraceae bacterium]HLS81573.1 FKBP-type peptidyl-prolyl cis-trans isomerase [Steroidobacter sp.]
MQARFDTVNRRVLLAIACAALAACTSDDAPQGGPARAPQAVQVAELQRMDLAKGVGEGISQGQIAVVHYTGWLYDPAAPDYKGRKFDSSRDAGQPFRFPVGGGKVIRGWDEGVQGMQVGGRRRLVIPADLAYGPQGAGGVIPPNAALLFEIELLGIESQP